jgi:hypothetical protein
MTHSTQNCEESPVVQNTEMLNEPSLKMLVDNDCQKIIVRCSPALVIGFLRYMASAS